MKLRLILFFSLAAVSTSAAYASQYTVKSFKLMGDDILTKQLAGHTAKNQLKVVDCNLTETDMICIFEPRGKRND